MTQVRISYRDYKEMCDKIGCIKKVNDSYDPSTKSIVVLLPENVVAAEKFIPDGCYEGYGHWANAYQLYNECLMAYLAGDFDDYFYDDNLNSKFKALFDDTRASGRPF